MRLRIEFGIFVKPLNFFLYNCPLQKKKESSYLLFVSFSSVELISVLRPIENILYAKNTYFCGRSSGITSRRILNL